KAARAIAQDGRGAGQPLALGNTRALYPAIDPVESLPNPDKIALLREVDAYARSRDPRIAQVIVSMAATIDTVLIAASDGTLAADVRPLVRINVQVIAHGLEGDFNRKGSSAFAGRMGQRVAAPGVTVVDDGTLPGRRGSLSVDDEGTPTNCTVLIEDGILKGY